MHYIYIFLRVILCIILLLLTLLFPYMSEIKNIHSPYFFGRNGLESKGRNFHRQLFDLKKTKYYVANLDPKLVGRLDEIWQLGGCLFLGQPLSFKKQTQ